MNMGQERQMQMVGVNGGNQFRPNLNGNVVAARAENNGNENNANQILCNNFRGVGHYARNYITRPRRRDKASTSGTHADKAPVYDSDGSTEVFQYENCYDNEIYNMFAQEEWYTKLIEPTTDTYLVQKDDNNVIPMDSSLNLIGGDVEQHPATIEETCAFYSSSSFRDFIAQTVGEY
ncbi:hypothetical protein Tco_1186307 [Tanacetum coccineum]